MAEAQIPPSPLTIPATPRAIALEIEPLLQRLQKAVVEHFEERLDAIDAHQSRILSALEHALARDQLLFDRLGELEKALKDHSKRLSALERIPRLPVKAMGKGKKRR